MLKIIGKTNNRLSIVLDREHHTINRFGCCHTLPLKTAIDIADEHAIDRTWNGREMVYTFHSSTLAKLEYKAK
jgi:hypothetical protein